MTFKMKGHALPGPNKMKSPVKSTVGSVKQTSSIDDHWSGTHRGSLKNMKKRLKLQSDIALLEGNEAVQTTRGMSGGYSTGESKLFEKTKSNYDHTAFAQKKKKKKK